MKKALIVGVDYYQHCRRLHGCVNDAYSVKSALERNGNGTLNFAIRLLTATGQDAEVTRGELRDHVSELFKDDNDTALLYFSGHGYIDDKTGGYLVTSECQRGDDGFSMNELLSIVNSSPAKNKLIVLDTCHSGAMGNLDPGDGKALLKEGVTILTASSATQYAMEEMGSGVFTGLFADALNGSAANLVGEITPGSVYAHIDQSLGPWQQRPLFKTNVKNFVTLKTVQAPIPLEDLKRIPEFFTEKNSIFRLDPSYEPESDSPDPANTEKFAVLQKLNRVNLVIPDEAPHMYHAAMSSKGCRLTVLGEHYWNLITNDNI